MDTRSQPSRRARQISMLTWLFAIGPSFLLFFAILHASTLYLHLGRWPYVYRDEGDGTALLAAEWLLVMLSTYWVLLGLPAWGACAIAFRKVLTSSRLRMQLYSILLALRCLALLSSLSRTGYAVWFFD